MEEAIIIPEEFLCPITTELMIDPVFAADGITYQRKAIQGWLKKSNNSAFTGKLLPHKDLISNYALKNTIQNFKKKLPNCMKQNQIKKDLQLAIKEREEQIKAFMQKSRERTAQSQKDEENNILKIKQLEKELKIERRSHSQTQKKYLQLQNKHAELEIQTEELKEQLKIYQQDYLQIKKKAQIENKNVQKDYLLNYNLLKMMMIPKNALDQFKKDSMNVQQLLKGIKRINITPNQNGYCFKSGWLTNEWVKIDQKNSKVCITSSEAYIFSNEQLPIKNKSFYFSIKSMKKSNKISIGIAYPNDITSNSFLNQVYYSLHKQSLCVFYKSSTVKPYSYINQIKIYPSQLIVFVDNENKTISIIYNNKVQLKIPITEQMTFHSNKCLAFIKINEGSEVQFV